MAKWLKVVIIGKFCDKSSAFLSLDLQALSE